MGSESDQNGIRHASVEVSLDDGSGLVNDGVQRTYDGKFRCRYCNYASKGTARLTEHIRMHTGNGCMPLVYKQSEIEDRIRFISI